MHQVMEYCVSTPKCDWLLPPGRNKCDKDKMFKFFFTGQSNSDHPKCPVTRRSVTCYSIFLEDAPVTFKSAIQKIAVLSVTEAETVSAIQCAQDMLYVKCLLESMELEIDLELEVDNSGVVDLANNWSTGAPVIWKHVCFSCWTYMKKE